MTDPRADVILDVESTSLIDPLHHYGRQAWEVAMIRRGLGEQEQKIRMFVRLADLRLQDADPESLRVGRFYERHPEMNGLSRDKAPHELGLVSAAAMCRTVSKWTHDCPNLLGSNVQFDAHTINRMAIDTGNPLGSWYYRLTCVKAGPAALLGLAPHEWSTQLVMVALGLNPDDYDLHTALSDAEWARDVYDATRRIVAELGLPDRLRQAIEGVRGE